MQRGLATARFAKGRGVSAIGRPSIASRWFSSSPSSQSTPGPNKAYLKPTHAPTFADSSAATQKLLTQAERYLLPVYARPELVLSHGKGSRVWDTEGRRYLDFSAGIAVNALGHGDEELVEVMKTEASRIIHTSNVYHNVWAPQLASLLIELTKSEGGLGWATGSAPHPSTRSQTEESTNASGGAKVFFANSGTEANEGAIKIARKVGKSVWSSKHPNSDLKDCDKTELVAFTNAFHGRSMGALSLTANEKYQAPFRPLIPGVRVGTLNGELEGLIGEKTCAVFVEPVQGEGGVRKAEEGWLREVRKRCEEVGAVLVFDEIQCGLYRTGTLWAHSTLPEECQPDIVTAAKPLAGGYPFGAVLMKDWVAEVMTAGTHGTTFGGSPLACALGHHVVSRLSARPFVAQVNETAAYLHSRLSRLAGWFPDILEGEIRGKGLMLGLVFKDGKGPGEVVRMARERGVLLLTAGSDAVRLVPSLNIGTEEVDVAVDVIESCLSVMKEEKGK